MTQLGPGQLTHLCVFGGGIIPPPGTGQGKVVRSHSEQKPNGLRNRTAIPHDVAGEDVKSAPSWVFSWPSTSLERSQGTWRDSEGSVFTTATILSFLAANGVLPTEVPFYYKSNALPFISMAAVWQCDFCCYSCKLIQKKSQPNWPPGLGSKRLAN